MIHETIMKINVDCLKKKPKCVSLAGGNIFLVDIWHSDVSR